MMFICIPKVSKFPVGKYINFSRSSLFLTGFKNIIVEFQAAFWTTITDLAVHVS